MRSRDKFQVDEMTRERERDTGNQVVGDRHVPFQARAKVKKS
jgi:hypothetical protein